MQVQRGKIVRRIKKFGFAATIVFETFWDGVEH